MGTKRAQAAESIHPGDAQNTGGLSHASTSLRGDLAIAGGICSLFCKLGAVMVRRHAIATSVIGFAYLALADGANPSIYASRLARQPVPTCVSILR